MLSRVVESLDSGYFPSSALSVLLLAVPLVGVKLFGGPESSAFFSWLLMNAFRFLHLCTIIGLGISIKSGRTGHFLFNWRVGEPFGSLILFLFSTF